MSEIVCSLVYLLRDDEILLAMKKRGFGMGRWNGAGGKIDPGETIPQAAVRECQEEIGVTPFDLEKVAIHTFIAPGDKPDMIGHVFVTRKWEGDPIETDEMAPQWFTLTALPYNTMWDSDILWLPAVLSGKKLKTTFSFDEHEMMTSAHIDIVSALE
jgi:8-oxo-dGTP diphosphatase